MYPKTPTGFRYVFKWTEVKLNKICFTPVNLNVLRPAPTDNKPAHAHFIAWESHRTEL